MKNSHSVVLMLSVLGASCAWSQTVPPQQPVAQVKPNGQAPWTEGEVRKIDKPTGRITFRHGEIVNLQMPAMTMAYMARDAGLLHKVKVGDKVRFIADKAGGQYLVTAIEPLR